MSTTLGVNKFSVPRISISAEIPKNNLARLMYYLSCVFTVIQYEGYNKFSDYKNYYNLTEKEKGVLYDLVIKFSPSLFVNAGIFIVNPQLLNGNNSNGFFKVTDEKIAIHVNQEMMIGGKAVKVLKIMVCTESWLDNNYFNPLKGINDELNCTGNDIIKYNSSINGLETERGIIVNQNNPTDYNATTTTTVTIKKEKEFDWCKCVIFSLLCIYCGPFFWIYLCFCWDRGRDC